MFDAGDRSPWLTLIDENISYCCPAWSPDGRWLAYIERHGPAWKEGSTQSIHVISSEGHTRLRLSPDFGFSRFNLLHILGWSADSQWLAFEYESLTDMVDRGYATTAYIADLDSAELHLVEYDVMAFAWSSSDPSRFGYAVSPYSGRIRTSLYTATTDTLSEPRCLTCDESDLEGVYACAAIWSPDGRKLAWVVGEACADFWFDDFSLWAWDLDTGEREIIEGIAHAEIISWSVNGEWLATCDSEEVVVYRVADWSIEGSVKANSHEFITGIKWADSGGVTYALMTDTGMVLMMLLTPDTGPFLLWDSNETDLAGKDLSGFDWHVD